jgi:hypothetical protein
VTKVDSIVLLGKLLVDQVLRSRPFNWEYYLLEFLWPFGNSDSVFYVYVRDLKDLEALCVCITSVVSAFLLIPRLRASVLEILGRILEKCLIKKVVQNGSDRAS